ncbi:hypothetical protein [Aquimarina megaterium]|uniref:hypothetical protein n=1 Tax=Aquimarina megaterium TaxID=1443666 RepID=UPI000471DBFE|nr:hypothetical protein [Aquimarina megaterium]
MTRYLIENVDIVDYVTLELCADISNGINSVNVVEERTTHKTKNNINKLIDYLKSMEYPKDGPLIDKCRNLTFSFINPSFDKMKLDVQDCDECTKYKYGKYNYHHINYKNTKIKRNRRIQKEIGEKDRQIYKIEWTSNCSYILTYQRMSEPKLRSLIGGKIEVEIIKLLENNGYVYRSIDTKGIVRYGAIYKSD